MSLSKTYHDTITWLKEIPKITAAILTGLLLLGVSVSAVIISAFILIKFVPGMTGYEATGLVVAATFNLSWGLVGLGKLARKMGA